MPITIDHLALTVVDIDATIAFYTCVLGMRAVAYGDRKALHFDNQKINLYQRGREFEPKARHPTPGSAELCFIPNTTLPEVVRQLENASVRIELGPVERTGATGNMSSIYLRDPDANLLELWNHV